MLGYTYLPMGRGLTMERCKDCVFYTEQLDFNDEPTGNTHCTNKHNAEDIEGNTSEKDCPYTFLYRVDFAEELQYNNAIASAEEIAGWAIGIDGVKAMLDGSPTNDIYKHALGILLQEFDNVG